jgi:hypothetical protein
MIHECHWDTYNFVCNYQRSSQWLTPNYEGSEVNGITLKFPECH